MSTAADRYLKPVTPAAAAGSEAIDDLMRPAELHSRGVLTDDECTAERTQVLVI